MLQKLTQLESADHYEMSNSGIPHPLQMSMPEDRWTLVCIRTHAFPQSQDTVQMGRLLRMAKFRCWVQYGQLGMEDLPWRYRIWYVRPLATRPPFRRGVTRMALFQLYKQIGRACNYYYEVWQGEQIDI